MKKIIGFILIALIILPALGLAQNQTSTEAIDPRGQTTDISGKVIPPRYCFNILKQGAKGPEIEDLQNILKSDPSIYPEGLVTGYFGSMTRKAIERLQKKFNLPQTGEIDEELARIILPCPIDVKLTVISPNGGESWDRKETQEIKWQLSKINGTTTLPMTPSEIESKFFWPRGRIDLIRSDGTLAKHIAIVNLSQLSYQWKIGPAIPNGSDYKIRIGLGPSIACPEGKICPLSWHPKFTFGDESDGPFSIIGETPPSADKISEAIKVLQEVIQQLQKLISLLESLR